jgi:hypothetical protein
MFIDHITEYQLIQKLIRKLPAVDPHNTLVLNVSPDYSSTVSMHVAHHLSQDGKMLDMLAVEVPYPKEDKGSYQIIFKEQADKFSAVYSKVILCEAAVLSGGNYRWIKEILLSVGYKEEDIITTALIQKVESITDCDYVGEYATTMPEFYYERYNKNWE